MILSYPRKFACKTKIQTKQKKTNAVILGLEEYIPELMEKEILPNI